MFFTKNLSDCVPLSARLTKIVDHARGFARVTACAHSAIHLVECDELSRYPRQIVRGTKVEEQGLLTTCMARGARRRSVQAVKRRGGEAFRRSSVQAAKRRSG